VEHGTARAGCASRAAILAAMPYDFGPRYAERTSRMRPSAVRDILRVSADPDVISLAGGLPAAELFPVVEYRAAFDAVMDELGPAALQYGVSEGYGPLREALAARLSHHGVECPPDRMLITNGSQQALDLLGKVLLDPGDPVVIERPSYLGGIQAFDQYEVDYLVIPTDDDGMDVDRLAEVLEIRAAGGARLPKFVYVLPNFQNPSGRTLSLARRHRLLEIASRYGVPIVEDDPYGELRYEGAPLPTLHSLDREGLVVYVGTFSKILAPGIRLGWIAAPTGELFRTLVLAKQPSDLHTAGTTQMTVERLLRDGLLERHIPLVRACYHERRDAMARAIDEHFPTGVGRTHPAGGLFLWATLPAGSDTSRLLIDALRHKVAFVPGESFHVDGTGRESMRLNFSAEQPDVLREGIRRLGGVIAEQLDVERPPSVATSGPGR
jgi:2-aminoadipate transaminase